MTAIVRNALKQAPRRSQRTTKRRYLRCHHAHVRSACKRGIILSEGAPAWFFGLPDPFRNLRPDPAALEAVAEGFRLVAFLHRTDFEPLARSAPLPGAEPATVQQGMAWARSSPFAGVVRMANGMPAASVRVGMRGPLPCRRRVTPSPPPMPGGKGRVNSAVVPVEHRPFLSQPQQAGLHRGEGALRLPALQPPMGGALGGPLRAAGEITPPAAGDEDIEQGVDDLAKGGMWHAATALHQLRRTQIGKQLPRSTASPVECASHGALPYRLRVL